MTPPGSTEPTRASRPDSAPSAQTGSSSPPARNDRERRVFVGMTGASGHAYARTLLQVLAKAGIAIDLALSNAGAKVLLHEEQVAVQDDGTIAAEDLAQWLGVDAAAAIRVWGTNDIGAPPASGTALGAAVILCPCSMGTLARVAAGFSSNLVERAADVAIKERRRLILVPRESPLSAIHLENMLRLAKLGATVVPASPGFYHHPKTIDDLLQHLVGKVLDAAGIESSSSFRWGGLAAEPPAEAGTTSEVDTTSSSPPSGVRS